MGKNETMPMFKNLDKNPKINAILNSKVREARVTRQLLLQQVKLVKISPCLLEKLGNLRHLYIVGCSLIGSVPYQLVNMSELQTLNLSNNQLNLFPSSIFENLHSLTTLNLSCNQFVTLPKSLKYLQHLTTLNLSNNKLLDAPIELAYLRYLKHLDLSHNLLNTLRTDAICEAWRYSLKALKLANNVIDTLPPQIGLLVSLQELDVRDNRLRHLPSTVQLLTKINVFHYSGNEWRTVQPHSGYSTFGQHMQDDDVKENATSYGTAALEKLLSYSINPEAGMI